MLYIYFFLIKEMPITNNEIKSRVCKLVWFFLMCFYKGCVIFDRTKTDFLRQLRLSAAHTVLRRQKKGSNYAEMKAWQNERCFQLEPWLFHYFNIYKDEPPTVVRAAHYAMLYVHVWMCLNVCVCIRAKRRRVDGDRRRRGGWTNTLRVREWHSLTNWIWWMSQAVRNDLFIEMFHASMCIHQCSVL